MAEDPSIAGPRGRGPGSVTVFVYGDYVCPFSYIAAERLRRLQRDEPLTVHWRPFEIHPAVPAAGLAVREAGYPPDEWAGMASTLEGMAAELDLPFRLPDFVANSHQALQAAEFARDLGPDAFRGVQEALFRAYFVDGRNVGEREVLLDVTAGHLDREALEAALEDGRYEDELRRASAEAERYDVAGTPTFLFGRFKVVGAAPIEVLREAAAKARSEWGAGSGGSDAAAETRAGEAGEPEAG